MKRVFPVLALLTLASLAACALLVPFEDYQGTRPSDGDAGDASIPGDGPRAPDACRLSRWPERPTSDAGTGTMELVQGLTSFDLATKDGGAGFDLDGVCTCDPDPGSCTRADAAAYCDDEGGVDRSLNELAETLASLADTPTEVDRIAHGQYTILVRIREYNGTADDPNVFVEVFSSPGLDGVQDGGPASPPTFDGTDVWTVDPSSLFLPKAPPHIAIVFDEHAYVANGTLVAMPRDPLTLKAGGISVLVRAVVLTGKLRREGELFVIDEGALVGRVRTTDFLTGLEAARDPITKGGVCGDAGLYPQLSPRICEAADIMSDRAADNSGSACDAMSLAARFTTRPAILGPVYGRPRPPRPCGDAWVGTCP